MDAWIPQLVELNEEKRNISTLIEALESLEDIDTLLEIYENQSNLISANQCSTTPISALFHTYHKLRQIPSATLALWNRLRCKNIEETLSIIRTLLEKNVMDQVDEGISQAQWISVAPDDSLIWNPFEPSFIYLICEVMMNQEQVKISLSRICAKMLLQFDKAMLIYGKQGNRHAWPYRL